MSDPRSDVQLDQALIKQSILSQLDAIGKRLSVIESSASVAHPEVKNSVCGRATSMQNYLIYTQLAIINCFKSRSRIELDSCLILIKRYGSENKITVWWSCWYIC